jgi:fatty acid desaturase
MLHSVLLLLGLLLLCRTPTRWCCTCQATPTAVLMAHIVCGDADRWWLLGLLLLCRTPTRWCGTFLATITVSLRTQVKMLFYAAVAAAAAASQDTNSLVLYMPGDMSVHVGHHLLSCVRLYILSRYCSLHCLLQDPNSLVCTCLATCRCT